MSVREEARRDSEFDRLLTVALHTVSIDGTDLYAEDGMRAAYEMGKRHEAEKAPQWHDAPTCAGWYWYRAPEHKLWVVEVIESPSGIRVRFEWGWMALESTHKKSEWAGPIPAPLEVNP
jgi:hypothetical protein